MTTAATTASSCVITLNNKTASFRLFGPARPFDLSTRAGMEAFNQSSKSLDKTFGGDVNDWPEFLTDLQLRASRVKWDAAAPNGILTINGRKLLTEYHHIADVDTTAATQQHVANGDHRAIQNNRALYLTLCRSITGDIRATLRQQTANHTDDEDGTALFKQITKLHRGRFSSAVAHRTREGSRVQPW